MNYWDERSMSRYINDLNLIDSTRKMTDETNTLNIQALKTILPFFYLSPRSHNTVLNAIDKPPIHPLWTRPLNNQHRLIMPVEKSETTDIAYNEYKELIIYSSALDIPLTEKKELLRYDTWVSGRLKNGMRLFKYLSKQDINQAALTRISTIRQTDTNYLVLSKNPVDWLFMSTGQSFSSCMSLESSHSEAVYYGLPAYMVNPHAFLLFLTNGKLRTKIIKNQTFKYFRIINRSIAMFTDKKELGTVRYYPNKTISYSRPLRRAGIVPAGEIWETHNWPAMPALEFSNGEDCCPYYDCGAYSYYHSAGKRTSYFSSLGASGSSISFEWDDGFEYATSIEDLAPSHICDFCNCRISNENDVYYFSNSNMCQDCFNDRVAFCEHCADQGWVDDMTYIDDGSYYVCDHCRPEKYTMCDICNDVVHNDSIGFDEIESIDVCKNCGDLQQCEQCERVTNSSNLYHELCEDCREDLISERDRLEELVCEKNERIDEINELLGD